MKETDAARAILLEVLSALGPWREQMVIVGGWVPDLLYPTKNHMGSLDVDLAISPSAFGGDVYSSIRQRLSQIGYTMQSSPTRFLKLLPGLNTPIKVDLLTGQYASNQKQDFIQIDEIRISALRGIDLAFEAPEPITIEGRMPDGSLNAVTARLVTPEAFILIKAIALGRTRQRQRCLRYRLHPKTLPPLPHGPSQESAQTIESRNRPESIGTAPHQVLDINFHRPRLGRQSSRHNRGRRCSVSASSFRRCLRIISIT